MPHMSHSFFFINATYPLVRSPLKIGKKLKAASWFDLDRKAFPAWQDRDFLTLPPDALMSLNHCVFSATLSCLLIRPPCTREVVCICSESVCVSVRVQTGCCFRGSDPDTSHSDFPVQYLHRLTLFLTHFFLSFFSFLPT